MSAWNILVVWSKTTGDVKYQNMFALAKNAQISFTLLSIGTVLIAINIALINTSKWIKRNNKVGHFQPYPY
ncbi:hypothetical protein KQI42_05715 [Tissierella sp. MSJ-40]|uniref:Uncharacterized protein n=1 Tax=Tissierella simiarum TaxID=2841534 RepID=A0ABS6E3K6_9FIRM|nr:hypothetical protein [Tissierella simiarum]MBU5437493.1 hypothetical protein [Tissierella simiarum]